MYLISSVRNHVESKPASKQSQPNEKPNDFPLEEQDELDILTLAQILGDIRPAMLRSPSGSNNAACDSTDADEADSMNTRNEYWSVSSFRTKAYCPDSDESFLSDWLVPPPTDGQTDFALPLESLDKPIKKNTYSPVQQRVVEQFLKAAVWNAEPTEDKKETLWGEKKKLPLKPVEGLPGCPFVTTCGRSCHRDDHKDLFLQNIQPPERNHEQTVACESSKNPLGRYPGTETVYSEFMREDALTGNRLSVKMISTQTTNPPERVLRFYRQGVVQPVSPVALPPIHKVSSALLCW